MWTLSTLKGSVYFQHEKRGGYKCKLDVCGATKLTCVSLRLKPLLSPPGCISALAKSWPLPLPPAGTAWELCSGRTPCVALATGLTLAAGRELFMFVLPGATGSSRRLLLRGCIGLEMCWGAFYREKKLLLSLYLWQLTLFVLFFLKKPSLLLLYEE